MNIQEKESKIYVQIEKRKDRWVNVVEILTDRQIRNGEQEICRETERDKEMERKRYGEIERLRDWELERLRD
jgi:hypothetical protein